MLKLQYIGHLIWRTDSLAKTLMLGNYGQGEKGTTEDEMVGWHHRLNGHEFEQAPGDGEGQGSLMCCSWTWLSGWTTMQIIVLGTIQCRFKGCLGSKAWLGYLYSLFYSFCLEVQLICNIILVLGIQQWFNRLPDYTQFKVIKYWLCSMFSILYPSLYSQSPSSILSIFLGLSTLVTNSLVSASVSVSILLHSFICFIVLFHL